MSDSPDAQERELAGWLREAVAEMLGVEPHEVDLDRPLTELGLSSRDGVGLVGELEDHLDRDLDPTLVFDTPTINAIARRLIHGEEQQSDPEPSTGRVVDLGDAGDSEPGDDAVAVVGLGCRLPGGVSGPRQLWRFLIEGGDAIREVPEDRWGQFTPPSPGAAAVVEGLNRWGGYLEDVSGFDAEFFGISPREAELMDPQQRMLLEVAYEALEDAGIKADTLRGSATGVFVGMSGNEYSHLTTKTLEKVDAYVSTGSAFSIASNRLSYLLDLRGPSMTVDTACSSSLVAIHQAARSIASGETTTAIVGGVNLALAPAITFTFDQAGAMAPDGRIKAFSDDANGMVRAEGCGVVVLKRLEDARRDGNHVLAVLRGSGVNQDGRSNGITAPNPAAQEALLRKVYADSGIEPGEVDYIEAHGTGTPLGDPIEAGSVGAALGGSRRDAEHPLLLGSAKTNFGHLEAAAGIVGFMKLVLSLYHDEIPPSLHYHGPNPRIKFEEHHLSVVTEPTAWPRYSGVARGGVSAFGFGGTNAHVVLEESGARNRRNSGVLPGEDEAVTTLVFSGGHEARVRSAAGTLATWLEHGGGAETALRDVAHTLARARVPGGVRGAVTARGRSGLVTALRALGEGLDAPNLSAPTNQMARSREDVGPVWIFSGFGSTWNGMGRRLLEEQPAFARTVDELDPLFRAEVGWSLREAIEADQDLADQEKAQILLFGVQIALAELWMEHGVRPTAIIGHSMGEISGAVVAGGLTRAAGVKLIVQRSRLMQEHNALGIGGMAVLQAGPDEFEAVKGQFPGVEIAVFGSPKAITIGGPKAPLEAAAAHFKELGRNAWVLPVGGASHSAQVDSALPDFYTRVGDVEAQRAIIPFYSTSQENPRETPDFGSAYWGQNLRNPVRFMQAIAAAAEDGHSVFMEISPHPVAEITTRQTLKAAGVDPRIVIPTLRRDGDDEVSFQTGMATLWAWSEAAALDRMIPFGRKVPLPRWQHRRFWVDEAPLAATVTGGHPLLGVHIELPEGNRHVWRADIGSAALPWLAGHRVLGAPILPGAAFAEMALAATTQVLGVQPLIAFDLNVEHVLALAEHTEVTTSLVVRGDDVTVEVFTNGNHGEPMRRHATATVRIAGAGAGLGPAAAPPGLATVDSYTVLQEAGLSHGAAFTSLLEPTAAEGFATAGVKLGSGAPGHPEYCVHPALLDACIQAVALAASTLPGVQSDVPRLAMQFGSVRLEGAAGKEGSVTAHADLDDDGTLTGAFSFFGPDGSLVLSAKGVILRVVERDEIPEVEVPADAAAIAAGRAIIDKLRVIDPAGAREVLAQRLLERVAAVMAHDPADLDVDAPLTALGFDSLMAVRAKNAVELDLGIELPVKLLLQGSCLADLEEGIAAELGLEAAGPRRVSLIPKAARFIEPRDPTERYIAAIWEEVLGRAPLSATANVDDLGATPEQLEQIVAKMRERLGEELTVAKLFATRSIETQADLLREQVEGNGGNPVRVLQAGDGSTNPLFLFHPAGGPTSVYQNLVDGLSSRQAVYGFERLEGVRTLEEKATHYIAMLRDIAPAGPYRLGGWSLGGCLAYEVAQQLKAQGESIDVVMMIDTTIPKPTPGVTEREILRDRFERFFAYMSETYDVPIDIDIEALVELDEDEQVERMLGLVKDSGIDMGAGVLEHQRTSYIDARIAERYLPKPFDGPIVLYRATERGLTTSLDPRYAREDDALGWDALTDELEIVPVRGTHISLIDKPGVDTMAAHLQRALDRTPAGSSDQGGAG